MTMHDSAQALRGQKAPSGGVHPVLDVLRSRQPHLPALPRRTGRDGALARFCGLCRQRHRSAHRGRGSSGPGQAVCLRWPGGSIPRFAQVFAVLVYLSIGPCLAIPRTASTSFEMLTPLVGRSTSGQFIYSLVFFAAAYFVALKPEKLTQRLGRILCPALLVLIVVLFAGCILRPAAPGYGTPAEAYAALPAAQGVLDGYQTMDALAALNFGAVIALNLQAVGITEESAVRRGTSPGRAHRRAGCCWWSTPC